MIYLDINETLCGDRILIKALMMRTPRLPVPPATKIVCFMMFYMFEV